MNCSSLSTGNTHWLAFFSSTFARVSKGILFFLGSHVDQFFIIKTDVQVFCQSLADEAPVASKHTIDSDNTFCHNEYLLYLRPEAGRSVFRRFFLFLL